jgi:hypothetical protein
MDEFLTPKQAAEFLGLAVGTLANWRVRGAGPRFFRLGGARGGHIRYDRADLMAFARAKPCLSTSQAA